MTEQLLSNIVDQLKTLNGTHAQLLATLSIIAQPDIEKRLNHIFLSSAELLAYKLSDGKRSSKEIGDQVDVSHTTITNWWKKWEESYKIVETFGYRNPYKAKYSLPELVNLFGRLETEKE